MPARRLAILGLTLLLGLAGIKALAHTPVAIGGIYDDPAVAVELPDPDVSRVVYGDLPVGRSYLWVAVDVAVPTELSLSLGVPFLERLRTYRPQLAVFGPGLPTLDVPVPVPAGLGGVLAVTWRTDDAPLFHEPFTGTDSWVLAESSINLPSAGRYYVVVWSASAIGGKAWVSIGTRESFRWRDLATWPQTINAVRAFHEVGRDPRLVNLANALYLSVAALLIAGLALLG